MMHSKDFARVAAAVVHARPDLDVFVAKGVGVTREATNELHRIATKHGIAILQSVVTMQTGDVGIETMLVHESGELIGDAMPVGGEWDAYRTPLHVLDHVRALALRMLLGVPTDAVGPGDAVPAKPKARKPPEEQGARKEAGPAGGRDEPEGVPEAPLPPNLPVGDGGGGRRGLPPNTPAVNGTRERSISANPEDRRPPPNDDLSDLPF